MLRRSRRMPAAVRGPAPTLAAWAVAAVAGLLAVPARADDGAAASPPAASPAPAPPAAPSRSGPALLPSADASPPPRAGGASGRADGPPSTRVALPDDLDEPATPPPLDPSRPVTGPLLLESGRVHLLTDKTVGRMKTYEVDDTTRAIVLVGNPHIWGDDYAVKARTIVVWFDKSSTSGLEGMFTGDAALGAPSAGAVDGGAKRAGDRASDAGPRKARKEDGKGKGGTPGGSIAQDLAGSLPNSVLGGGVKGVYAEGGVDLVAGSLVFRALELYLEPPTNRALLIEPRFDGQVATTSPQGQAVPLYVRAERARILARGFAAFDDAEVTTSRANDRLTLRVRSITIEEYGEAVASEPLFLGFRGPGTQRYDATGIQVRGEGVPLLYVPHAAFGGEKGFVELPLRIRRTSVGSRSSLGRYAFVGFGGDVGGAEPWLDWTVDVGGYTKRGPAIGTDLLWTHRLGKGRLQTFTLHDGNGRDRNGYRADDGLRGFAWLENRLDPTPAWRFDVEANVFTDRGVHREFFEGDARDHKDRDTYARVRWRDGGTAATATTGVHARDYATESIAQPELAVWDESRPLFAVPGGPAVDLSSEVRAGRMVRRFDTADPFDGYAAWRVDATERVYAPFSVGDVRVSPFVGARWTGYRDRDDGGDDVDHGALEAGLRGNVQLSRDFGAWGGPWSLDGLRHVVDVDVGGYGRFFDSAHPDDVPLFDRLDGERDRTEVFAEVRSRLVTRRKVEDHRENATLLDARLRVAWWPDGRGPYGRDGAGEVEGWLAMELFPRTAWLEASALASVDDPALRRASVGVTWTPTPDLSVGFGMRHVRDAFFGPWFDGYWRWSEKWGVRMSAVEDFERRGDGYLRLSLLRFSEDHLFEIGPVIRDHGRDVGLYFNLGPSIGGDPVRPVFAPRESFGSDAWGDGAR